MTTQQTTPRPPSATATPGTRPGSGLGPVLLVVSVVVAVLLVAWGALSLASLVARATETSSATYEGVTTVRLDLGFESVEIVGSATATQVEMDRSYSYSLSEPSTGADQDGDRLSLTSSCPFTPGRWCTGHVRLVVPRDVRLTGSTSDGRLEMRGLTGPVDASTSDGGIEASDLSGPVTLRTRDGHLTMRDLTGPVDVTSSDGDVEAAGLTGAVTYAVRDGSFAATDLASAEVTGESSDGSVRLDFAVPPTIVSARSRDGSVLVTVPDDGTAYAVTVEVSDGSRSVAVPTDPRSTRSIDVLTSDGSVRLGFR